MRRTSTSGRCRFAGPALAALAPAAATACVAFMPSAALAQTVTTWTGGAGSWSEAARWSNGMPNSAAFEARVDGGNAVDSPVVVDGNFTVGALTLSDGITIADGKTLTVDRSAGFAGAGTITGSSRFITFASTGAPTRLFAAGDVNVTANVRGDGNANNVVTGSPGSKVTLTGFFNSGIGKLGDGAVDVVLSGSYGSSSSGGTVVRPASTFVLAAGGVMTIPAHSVQLAGSGTFTLDGVVSVIPPSGSAGATFAKDATATLTNFDPVTRTLSGAGRYTVNAVNADATVALNVGDIYVNATELELVRPNGNINGIEALRENRGTITFNAHPFTTTGAFANSGTLIVAQTTFTSTAALTNTGTLRLIGFTSGDGALNLNAGLTQTSGTFHLGGTTAVTVTVNSPTAPISILGGALNGGGTINTTAVTVAGSLAPYAANNQPTRITILAPLTLTPTAATTVIVDATPTFSLSADLISAGATAIDGTFGIRVADSNPSASSIYTVLSSTSLTGSFDNIANGQRLFTVDGKGSFVVHYGPGSTYNPNNVVLDGFQAVVIPEPGAAALCFAFSSVALLRRRVRRPQ